jgi:uncharacterized protein
MYWTKARILLHATLLAASLALARPAMSQSAKPETQIEKDDCDGNGQAKYKLLTGQRNLDYFLVGKALVHLYNKTVSQEDRLEVCTSEGSLENVRRLSDGTATLAIVQSDVMHSVWLHHPLGTLNPSEKTCVFERKDSLEKSKHELYLIAPLYAESLHILLRPHLNIYRLQDLRGQHVWVGAGGSGSFLTAERVLEGEGLGICDVAHVEDYSPPLTTQKGLQLLANMQLDAMFFTGAAPTAMLQEQLDTSGPEIHLLPLDVTLIDQLSAGGNYVETLIRPDAYAGMTASPQGTQTIGVEALLVASNNSDTTAVVQKAIDFLGKKENQENLRQEIRLEMLSMVRASGVNHTRSEEASLSSIWRLPLLNTPTPAAFESYFFPMIRGGTEQTDAKSLFFKSSKQFVWMAVLWVALALALSFALLIWIRRCSWWDVKYSTLAYALFGMILTWLAGAFTLWMLEKNVNEDFGSMASSIGNLLHYVTPYFGRAALTRNGQTTIKLVDYVLSLLFLSVIWPFLKPQAYRFLDFHFGPRKQA